MKNLEKVYLAGGMKSGWQNTVIKRFQNKFVFFNPMDHKLSESHQYTVWDLHYLKKADIILAYLESDNPSGFGLTLEIGYAKSLSKTIILIDEKSNKDKTFEKQFKIVRESATIVFDDFDNGLDYFGRFSIYSKK